MPDDRFDMYTEDERAISAALRALPLATPARSAWAALESELQRSHTAPATQRRHWPAWIGLAATLVAAVIGVRTFTPSMDDGVHANPQPSAETLALIEQSQRLDAALATLDARSVPMGAESAMASAELEDLIGLTDLQLNAVTRDDEAQALWSRRVNLMNRLADARTTTRFDSYSDAGGAYLQNAAYRID